MSNPAPAQSLWARHAKIETNSILLLIGILIAISFGGLIEIAPLFYLQSTVEKVEGMRPYTPLELAGRNIYVREGCYLCHSQMIRALRDEVERYGNYSLAAESMYDHPFQWGSKRNGPDLARIGEKYSDDWHLAHLNEPRVLVPQSIMPSYAFLSRTPLEYRAMADHLRVLRTEGVAATITHGIRAATDDQTRSTMMPAFGKDGLLKRDEVAAVANHVRVLGQLEPEKGANLALGTKLFAENCAVCHGAEGKGDHSLGAPNLTDAIWLYGSDVAAISATIHNPRNGVMPAWGDRLDPVTIKSLTLYVQSLGGGR